MGEEGGVNLHCFVGNNAIFAIDPLGQAVYIVVAGTDRVQRDLSNQIRSKYSAALRYVYAALSSLESLSQRDYNRLRKCGKVYFDGKPYKGSFKSYKKLVIRELNSCLIFAPTYSSSIKALDGNLLVGNESWDQVVYVIHGNYQRYPGLNGTVTYAPQVLVQFTDGYRDQKQVLAEVRRHMRVKDGEEVIASCGQTWNDRDQNNRKQEALLYDMPKLKLRRSSENWLKDLVDRPILDYTPFRVRRKILR